MVKEHRSVADCVSHSRTGSWGWVPGIAQGLLHPLHFHPFLIVYTLEIPHWVMVNIFWWHMFFQTTVCPFCTNRSSVCVMLLVPTWGILNSFLVTLMDSLGPEMSECSRQGPVFQSGFASVCHWKLPCSCGRWFGLRWPYIRTTLLSQVCSASALGQEKCSTTVHTLLLREHLLL